MVIRRKSPNYPGIPLEAAVQVAATLYQGGAAGTGVGRGRFTPQDAATAWGYTGISGPVKIRMGALRQYGFIEGKKGEAPLLSGRALTVILRNQATPEHRQALQEAFLCPPTFVELHDRLPGAAQDALRQFLIVERNFTDGGANRLIEVYQASMAYAIVDEYDNMAGQDEPEPEEEVEAPPMVVANPTLTPEENAQMLTVPLPGGGAAALSSQMTPEQWEQMYTILEAYKAIIVRTPQEHPVAEPEHDGPQERDI